MEEGGMSIGDIRNPIVRRGILLALALPCFAICAALGAIWGAMCWADDYYGAWRSAWDGPDDDVADEIGKDETPITPKAW
jgi:hypothetical protein